MDAAARDFLERQRVAHLATVDPTGAPHVVPICFAIVHDAIYIAIDQKPKRGAPGQLRRLRNIQQNPHVAIVADVYDDRDWSRLGFVLLRGQARLLVDGDEHRQAIASLRERYEQYRRMHLEDRPVIAVSVARVTSWGQTSG